MSIPLIVDFLEPVDLTVTGTYAAMNSAPARIASDPNPLPKMHLFRHKKAAR